MFKNGYLRLLMTLVGLQRMSTDEDPDTVWIVPSTLTADQLMQSLNLIKQNEFSPPVFDDNREAEDFIRRKSAGNATKRRQAFDDEDDNSIDSSEEEYLFPAGGPTATKKSDALERLKKLRRRRRKSGSADEEEPSITEEQRRKREEARKARELEKLRKIKSELYVHDSDDETDEERDRIFFEQEEIRHQQKIAIMKDILSVGMSNTEDTLGYNSISTGKKRRASSISFDSEASDDEDGDVLRAREHSSSTARGQSEVEATDTPLSSPHLRSSQPKRIRLSSEGMGSQPESPAEDTNGKGRDQEMSEIGKGSVDIDKDEDEDEEDFPIAKTTRRRHIAEFIIDSSDEE
jgi:replication fork protection complex subunit Tof1/Swi1